MNKNFLLERYFAKYEEKFIKYMLCASDSDPLSVKELGEMVSTTEEGKLLLEEYYTHSLEYTQAEGCHKLRKKIIEVFYETKKFKIDQILVGAPEELIYITMRTLLKKGDEVIVSFPGYQSLYEVAKSIGCNVKLWKMNSKTWKFDIDELLELISNTTKLVVMNFPHNPSGCALSQVEVNRIIEKLSKHDILLFSDEMYLHLDISSISPSPVCNIYKNGISLCGMSKGLSMPGIRIGWLASQDKILLEKIKCYKDYTTICPPCASEILSRMGLCVSSRIFSKNIETVRKNLEYAKKFYEQTDLIGRYSFPKIGTVGLIEAKLVGIQNSEKLAYDMLMSKGLLVLPSTVFEMEKIYELEEFAILRIGYGRNHKSFVQAFDVFKEYILGN